MLGGGGYYVGGRGGLKGILDGIRCERDRGRQDERR